MKIRQCLKFMNKDTLEKLFAICGLTEEEYWLVRYAYIEKRMVQNTCLKLSISSTKYHNMLNVALAKIETTLKKVNKIHIFD